MTERDRTAARRSVNQTVSLVFGVVYLLVGVLGFFVDSSGFAATHGGKLLGIFMVNPLHDVAHLLIGAVLVAAAKALTSARAANTAIGAAYLLLGVLGLFLLDSSANVLALNAADNVLHLASAVLLLLVGTTADRTTADRTTVARV